jgi:hypothetical protein
MDRSIWLATGSMRVSARINSTWHAGWRRENAAASGAILEVPSSCGAATRSTPLGSVLERVTSPMASSTWRRALTLLACSSRPASVGSTRRVVRINSRAARLPR